MKIRTRITLAFLSLALIPLSLMSLFMYLAARSTLERQALSHLQAVAIVQKHRILNIIHRNQERLDLVASRTQLRLSLAHFLREPKTVHQDKMNRILRDARTSISDFRRISIYTSEDRIVASTEDSLIGKHRASMRHTERGRTQPSFEVFSLAPQGQLVMYFIKPLTLDNQHLGYVLIEANATVFEALVNNYTGLGRTGETLIVYRDADGIARFLTPLRFDPHAALTRVASKHHDAVPITQALFKTERLFLDAVDYRGEPVLAATAYIPETNWGVVVKTDVAETYAPLLRLRYILICGLMTTGMGIVLGAFLCARTLTAPIQKLTYVAEAIGQGELTRKADIAATDELGILGRAFNQMTTQLAMSNRKLYEEVEERKQVEETLREHEEQLRLLIDALPVCIAYVDIEQRYRLNNKAYENWFRLPRSDITGKTVQEVIGEAMYGAIQPRIEEALAGQPVTYESMASFPDANKRWIHATYVPDVDPRGRVHGFYALVEDITQRKEAETAVHRYADELERSNADLDAFVYIASHDLKEPLRGIHNYAQILQEDCAEKLDDDNKSDLAILGRLVQRMDGLIDDLRLYARIGRTDDGQDRLDMNELVAEVCEQLYVLLEENNVSVRIPHSLPIVQFNRSSLFTVMQNLIANAARYNDEPDKWIEIGQYDDGQQIFYVQDNGIGIDPDLHDEAFRMFRRLTARDKYGSGSGAGLAIVRRSLERHGGRIWLASQPGKGTTFYFTLGAVAEGTG